MDIRVVPAHSEDDTWGLTLRFLAKKSAAYKNLRFQALYTSGGLTVKDSWG